MSDRYEIVQRIISENKVLWNIGGYYFEGTTRHNRKEDGLLSMSDLQSFEDAGIIKRIYGVSEQGKLYVRAFKRIKSMKEDA